MYNSTDAFKLQVGDDVRTFSVAHAEMAEAGCTGVTAHKQEGADCGETSSESQTYLAGTK